VVSNSVYFPFHIWDVILPIDELIYFFEMVKTHQQHHQPDMVNPVKIFPTKPMHSWRYAGDKTSHGWTSFQRWFQGHDFSGGFLVVQISGEWIYPLVMTNIAIENDHRNSGFSH
jgi:hypothetical protein